MGLKRDLSKNLKKKDTHRTYNRSLMLGPIQRGRTGTTIRHPPPSAVLNKSRKGGRKGQQRDNELPYHDTIGCNQNFQVTGNQKSKTGSTIKSPAKWWLKPSGINSWITTSEEADKSTVASHHSSVLMSIGIQSIS